MSFTPFVRPETNMKEFSFGPLIMGIILGIIFGASSLYLALKVGMTVSASIPVAVLSITLFRAFSKAFRLRRTTILENNLVQTTGSAGESIAFGVAVTMPALLILGFDMDIGRIMTVAVLGGLLGVLMMIPLRRALIVKEHGKLIYPEGTACAEVLKVGEKEDSSGKIVFAGFFLGLIYKVLNVGSKMWKDTAEVVFNFFPGAKLAAEVSPELLGVGYIIGLRTAAIMMAGGVLSSFVLIPMIKLFGSNLTEPLYPATMLIKDMSIHDVWKNYVLYIGAGAVATGGIISLFKSFPTIVHGAIEGLKNLKNANPLLNSNKRTDQDLPLWVVAVGCCLLVAAIMLTPKLHVSFFGALLIIVFGFLFVTVSSRLTGEIGSSSNPISGMTVATLLLTCLIFLALGKVGPEHRLAALSIAAVVCIAAANGGTTSQDLKTGYLVGATPKWQQIGLLFGALTSALVIGYSLDLLNKSSTIYSTKIPATVVDVKTLSPNKEQLFGADRVKDPNEYNVLFVTETSSPDLLKTLGAGKYLVDDTGVVKYLVDPGINGKLEARDDGQKVMKYEAPKARLMSLIIDGILTQKLPWGLVLLGAAIALVLELCGVGSLAFAVGVYLPISASTPIFVGGIIRYFVDRHAHKKKQKENDNNPIHDVKEDASSGALFSSGLIAGGSISGIALALTQVFPSIGNAIDFSKLVGSLGENNLFATIMFGFMAIALYLVSTMKVEKK